MRLPDSLRRLVALKTYQFECSSTVDESLAEIFERMIGAADRMPVGFHIFMCIVKSLLFQIPYETFQSFSQFHYTPLFPFFIHIWYTSFMQDKESYFINLFPDTHIGDDGAVIGNTVYSKDLFCEDIHFKRSWMSLEQIARKSMLVNISDAIAMNAHPQYALLGVAMPRDFGQEQMRALARGFLSAADRYGIQIIGGDTVAGERLDISVTLVSHSDAPLYRKGTAQGDLVAHTGELGSVKRDLEALMRGEPVAPDSKFITPRLRETFLYEAAPLMSAALDISDGLSKDLSRLSAINGVGFSFTQTIDKSVLCSGEEYEILFTFKPQHREEIEAIAKKHNTPLNIFAIATTGSYESICPPNHFQG